jgi:septal ring factor EnvC (AmiA/AmiB activator)
MRGLGIGILFWITAVSAADSTQEQLHQLEQRIQELQAQMHDIRTQYGTWQRQLQESEEDIGEVALRLETLHGALSDKQLTLANFKQEQEQLQSQLNAQRQKLAQQIRAAYIMGRQDYLKLWLNQEDSSITGRMLTYYDYFNRARSRQIAKMTATLQRARTLKQTIELETTNLNQLVINHTQKKKELLLNHKERQKILAQLANTLENQSKELKRLQENKHHLETLLGTLEEAVKNIPSPPGPHKVFAQLKGQLPYPVPGKVIKQFGERLIGSLKWQGILIASPTGKKVSAVATGRVVFAQWFRHFGLLVIIDHGEGYMSLYAHNQSLYIKTGDWVTENDIIATVGNSGGRKISALYFEIRHQGVPQAPQQWLR